MASRLSSLLDFKTISQAQIESLFLFAESLRQKNRSPRGNGEAIILAFFEPSTRTRLSFEMACQRAGVGPILFDGGMKTSLEKGETIEDSILNMAAMSPAALVIRSPDQVDLHKIVADIPVPVINAGWGSKGHPTQALLDLFTVKSKLNSLAGKNILIVGDVKHSRVANSHLELAKKLEIHLGQCGPQGFLAPEEAIHTFPSLQEGLRWADVVMALRFQFERHEAGAQFSKIEYKNEFGLNAISLKSLKKTGLILHPGPINHGIELETEILSDPRCCVLEQVHNGVFVREAIVRILLGETP